jgi:GAF domain-containing protein
METTYDAMPPDQVTEDLHRELEETKQTLGRRIEQMHEIQQAGIALSSEQDLNTLQDLILLTCRRMTQADAGTLYTVQKGSGQERTLLFSASQTDSVDAPYHRQVVPLDRRSIAGFVASTQQILKLDDVYDLPAGVEYVFNPWFDQAFGYRTRSVLAVPMTNLEGSIVGVVQLINRKRDFDAPLSDPAAVDDLVEPFTAEDEQVASALASQAAVALENRLLLETNRLYQELQGYVREVSKVTSAATDVEAGTFEPESLAGVAAREDALGRLARVFQQMGREVQAREQRLKQQVQQLHIEIDQAKKAREVSAITESDYFQQLQQKARDLRQRKGGE